MLLIDRYLSKSFLLYFLAGILVFVTLFFAVDALSTLLQYQGVEASSLMRYYLYYLPEILQKMLPISCLVGVVLTLSSLNRGSELVALFASGMSLLRISLPLLFWVLLISAGYYFASDRLSPTMAKEKNFIFYNEIEKKPGKFTFIKTNKIWYRSKNSIFNIKTLNPELSKAQGLSMYFFNENWDLLQMLTAEDVVMEGTKWKLRSGTITLFNGESSFPITSQFKEKTIMMNEDAVDLQNTGKTSDLLDQKELGRFIEKNKEAGLETLRYEVDYHSKFGFIFSGFVMCLLGIPFCVGRSRSGGMMLNIGISVALVFGYWVLYSSALTLGGHGTIPPLVAAWAPNGLMAVAALFLLKRLRR